MTTESEIIMTSNERTDRETYFDDIQKIEQILSYQATELNDLFRNQEAQAKFSDNKADHQQHIALALKAQDQCRATLEALIWVRNPQQQKQAPSQAPKLTRPRNPIFEEFYSVYPGINRDKASDALKGSKQAAREAWDAIPSLLGPKIVEAAKAYGQFLRITEGISKSADKWLSGREWETDYTIKRTTLTERERSLRTIPGARSGLNKMPSPAGG